MSIPHTINREAWLQEAVRRLEPIFSKAGYAIPPVRVSCGFPASSSPRTTLGQCWPRERSGDGVNEIFISPKLDEPVQLLDTLVHELCHAVDDCFSGHGGLFEDELDGVPGSTMMVIILQALLRGNRLLPLTDGAPNRIPTRLTLGNRV